MKSVAVVKSISLALASTAAAYPLPVHAEIEGACSKAVGTFLTTNDLDNNGRTGTSRSVLVLTNGGHALRFDSDEMAATMDSHPFGDSAGTWRCNGVDDDGTVQLTVSTLDFTYPNAEGDPGQIGRIDATGTYAPATEVMKLDGKLAFLPLNSDGQKDDALSKASTTISVKFTGQRVDVPKAP